MVENRYALVAAVARSRGGAGAVPGPAGGVRGRAVEAVHVITDASGSPATAAACRSIDAAAAGSSASAAACS